MGATAVAIPEKLFFKIGEVCDIVGVQAHVLRYWETEFPMFSPQKNRAGQRTYRKRDVEIALRIKELLYEELYTIAGAKKRLTIELRGGGNKLKSVENETQISTQTFTQPQPTVSQTQYAPQPEAIQTQIHQKPQTQPQSFVRESYVQPSPQPYRSESRTEARSEVTRMPLPERNIDAQKQSSSVRHLAFELRELLAMMDSNDLELKKLNRRR
jgi:DNA-binding transcriptional MerR regulator